MEPMISTETRIERIETLFISYPRLQQVLDGIDACRLRSKKAIEAECCLITGDTGAGKTTVIHQYLNMHARYHTDCSTIIPVFAAAIPATATIKGVVSSLLRALRDAFPDRGTTVTQTFRVYERLKDCQVQLLILDEFQHLVDQNSSKVLVDVADWIKMLVNETKIPVVLVGMPWAEGILSVNPQLKRRFARHLRLDAFPWEESDSNNEFLSFLAALDCGLPFNERNSFVSPELAPRLYCASQGRVGQLTRLVRAAAVSAVYKDLPSVTFKELSKAFEEQVWIESGLPFNPFEVELKEVKNQLGKTARYGAPSCYASARVRKKRVNEMERL